jgi:NADPH:quinone reductase-like Zn-dependent oxidoreductase
MKHHVVHRPGGFERLVLETRPDPIPDEPLAPDAVTIDVSACGVNFADCIVRMGLYESAKHYVGWPITPGFEVAGRVRRVGAAVSTFRAGDPVIGVTRFGGYTTRITLPTAQVFHRPPNWSDAEAAAFPAVHLTAWWALFELAHPRPGARMLVHSAAGGVGQALCALGRIAGTEVTGVVGSAAKVEAARRAGAAVVEVAGRGLEARLRAAAPGGFDVVLDATGYETLPMSWRLLAPGGKLVVYGFHSMFARGRGRPDWLRLVWGWLRTPRFNPLDLTGANKSLLAFNLSYLFDRTDLLNTAMTELTGHVADGRLRAPEVTTFPFDQAPAAHRALSSGATTGKLVLVV